MYGLYNIQCMYFPDLNNTHNLVHTCNIMFVLLSEFEGLYWTEQKSRAQQKQRDNAILVS